VENVPPVVVQLVEVASSLLIILAARHTVTRWLRLDRRYDPRLDEVETAVAMELRTALPPALRHAGVDVDALTDAPKRRVTVWLRRVVGRYDRSVAPPPDRLCRTVADDLDCPRAMATSRRGVGLLAEAVLAATDREVGQRDRAAIRQAVDDVYHDVRAGVERRLAGTGAEQRLHTARQRALVDLVERGVTHRTGVLYHSWRPSDRRSAPPGQLHPRPLVLVRGATADGGRPPESCADDAGRFSVADRLERRSSAAKGG